MLCFLSSLSLGVPIGVSATSCGQPVATTSGHSMAASTGDFLIFSCFLLDLSLEVATGVSQKVATGMPRRISLRAVPQRIALRTFPER